MSSDASVARGSRGGTLRLLPVMPQKPLPLPPPTHTHTRSLKSELSRLCLEKNYLRPQVLQPAKNALKTKKYTREGVWATELGTRDTRVLWTPVRGPGAVQSLICLDEEGL